MASTRSPDAKKRYTAFISVMIFISLLILFPQYIASGVVYYRVHMNKQLVHEFEVDNDKVRIFIESRDEEFVLIGSVEKVEELVRKAYLDFKPLLVSRSWKEYKGEPPGQTFDLLFLNEETFGSFEQHMYGGHYEFNAFFHTWLKTAYLRGDGNEYDVSTRGGTIRHETFHYLSKKYNLNFEERAAQIF
ncbi:MAG: hypothetical protein WED06_02505 [Candidatus Paceibacterota bacterium]